MPDITGTFGRNPEPDHLIVGPERTVHEHTGGRLHGAPYRIVDGAQARRIHRRFPAALILDDQRQVVAGDGRVAVGRIRSGLAGDRQCAPPHSGHGIDVETGIVQFDSAPVHTAKIAQHAEHGIAAGEIGEGAVGAPDGPRAHRFTQHIESGGMVDLAVDEDDGGDGAVAYRAARLQIGIRPQLRQDVGRCIHQRPGVAPGDGDGRLGTGTGPQSARTIPLAVWAIAIPLWKAAPGGRPQHPDFHEE